MTTLSHALCCISLPHHPPGGSILAVCPRDSLNSMLYNPPRGSIHSVFTLRFVASLRSTTIAKNRFTVSSLCNAPHVLVMHLISVQG